MSSADRRDRNDDKRRDVIEKMKKLNCPQIREEVEFNVLCTALNARLILINADISGMSSADRRDRNDDKRRDVIEKMKKLNCPQIREEVEFNVLCTALNARLTLINTGISGMSSADSRHRNDDKRRDVIDQMKKLNCPQIREEVEFNVLCTALNARLTLINTGISGMSSADSRHRNDDKRRDVIDQMKKLNCPQIREEVEFNVLCTALNARLTLINTGISGMSSADSRHRNDDKRRDVLSLIHI
eukprot:TRINITY_DN942_c0_g1_i4.p2 TRINITY_DN942_c0_g1~~TRINITY_DN942_c0_g1_i4.p2  ORF type:complete len:244 (-),score=47.72 TRINITY_DN942_c0_g1_i4:61-792(-)